MLSLKFFVGVIRMLLSNRLSKTKFVCTSSCHFLTHKRKTEKTVVEMLQCNRKYTETYETAMVLERVFSAQSSRLNQQWWFR